MNQEEKSQKLTTESKIEILNDAVEKIEDADYNIYFFCPDFEKPSGGVGLLYDHVRILNENGFKAKVLHTKDGFVPEWLEERAEGIPIQYLDGEELNLRVEDFLLIPEGIPQLMQRTAEQNVPCKRVVFCQNWLYVLNALPPGVLWPDYGINTCISVSRIQSDYLRMLMPGLHIKDVVGSIDQELFTPPKSMAEKEPYVAFIPSRDNGMKSSNVIKTFYAMFPHFRWVQFKELKGLNNEDFSEAIRKAAWYVHFDEYSSWGTAPIEAFNCNTLVAGWDGVGGREYMRPIDDDRQNGNTWVVPNGDIVKLAIAISNMVEAWMNSTIGDGVYKDMELAASKYTAEEEVDSVVKAHSELAEERIIDLNNVADKLKKGEL